MVNDDSYKSMIRTQIASLPMELDGLLGGNPKGYQKGLNSEEEGIEGAASQLYRKTVNTGAFQDLPVSMRLKDVKKIAAEAGVGLDGIKVRIVRDPELVGKGLCGWASPNGRTIELYPDAFTDMETLVKTLGHERTHLYQASTFGPPNSSNLLDYENGAYGSETSWWEYYQRNVR